MTAAVSAGLDNSVIVKFYDTVLTFQQGDARVELAAMPAASVQCVVTSPPYFHGRLYPAPDLVWGGNDRTCPSVLDHRWATNKQYYPANPTSPETAENAIVNLKRLAKGRYVTTERCLRCMAWRGQLGLEATPEEYVKHLLEVFTQVYRVLKDDGTLWLNLGDNYAGAGYSNHTGTGGARREDGGRQKHNNVPNVRNKSLLGVPWLVAFALQKIGFLLRSDIIWQKPDGMHEPVNDRPVKTYEHVFLLSKGANYYYNPKANPAPRAGDPDAIKNGGDVWTIPVQASRSSHNATMPELLAQKCILAGSRPGDTVLDPFGGAGTTALVALCNGRHGRSIELASQYHRDAIHEASELISRDYDALRAAGKAVCERCGLTYRRHPLAYEVRSYDGEPFLHRTCDGKLVKL